MQYVTVQLRYSLKLRALVSFQLSASILASLSAMTHSVLLLCSTKINTRLNTVYSGNSDTGLTKATGVQSLEGTEKFIRHSDKAIKDKERGCYFMLCKIRLILQEVCTVQLYYQSKCIRSGLCINRQSILNDQIVGEKLHRGIPSFSICLYMKNYVKLFSNFSLWTAGRTLICFALFQTEVHHVSQYKKKTVI